LISDFVAGCGHLRVDWAGDCRLQPWRLPGFSGPGIYWRADRALDFPATGAQGAIRCGNRRRALSNRLVDYRRNAIRRTHQPLQAEGILSGGDLMAEDEKLAVDQARQTSNQAQVKSDIRDRVNSQISEEAGKFDTADLQDASAVGRGLKRRAIREAATTESELDRARVVARISQVIDYIFYVIYGIIGLEILLDLLGAHESNAFKRFLDALAAPLVRPFNGLMHDPSMDHY